MLMRRFYTMPVPKNGLTHVSTPRVHVEVEVEVVPCVYLQGGDVRAPWQNASGFEDDDDEEEEEDSSSSGPGAHTPSKGLFGGLLNSTASNVSDRGRKGSGSSTSSARCGAAV